MSDIMSRHGAVPRRLLLYAGPEWSQSLDACFDVAMSVRAASRSAQVVLLTSSETPTATVPGVSVLELPIIAENGRAEDEESAAVLRSARAAIVQDVIQRFEPDLVVVDGPSRRVESEVVPAVSALARRGVATRLLVGLGERSDQIAAQPAHGRPALDATSEVAA
jgi:predicted glycosyltransferase